jgi:TonB family protein
MLLPRRSVTSTPLKTLFLCACLFVAGTRNPAPAQEKEAVAAGARPPAAVAITSPDTARAIKLYNENDYKAATEILRAAVKQRKDDAQAWLHLGIVHSRAGKPKDARKAFEQAIKLNPNAPHAYVGMAYISTYENKLPEAEGYARRAVAVDPNNAEAHYTLGVIALRKNDAAKALAEAETTLRLNPNFAGALLLKSEATMEVYSVASAGRAALNHALDQPMPLPSPEERARMGKMLTEAAESLEKYLKLSPASQSTAQLREQAEALRWHADTMSQSNAQPFYSLDEVTTKAQILSRPHPLYTEQARKSGITGMVRLRMLLSFDGRVRHILVLKGLGGGLTEMAINAARGIKFTPAIKDGRPVSQFITIEYNFHIF